jgi:predicted DNA-binding transcriptional regulator YafY
VSSELDSLVRELQEAATRLRAGDLEAHEAAALVERCAELAGRTGAELDRAAREAEREAPAGGQEQLL